MVSHRRRLFPHLKAKEVDNAHEDNKVLPSFASLRQRTLSTLYSSEDDDGRPATDKSAKGSVDAPIRELVDLINAHSSFATLSSCSGRISLWDAGSTLQAEEEETERRFSSTPLDKQDIHVEQQRLPNNSSGKGSSGKWLLVSHEVIEPDQLLSLFPEEEEMGGQQRTDDATSTTRPALSFQMEPLLLHVAAASLRHGQDLLRVVLSAGFRESGLVVTESRVTVAVRSYALSLTVPLSRQGPLRPSRPYLEALVHQANARLRQNQSRLQRLFDCIQENLFCFREVRLEHTWSPIPPLRLWNAATVVITSRDPQQQPQAGVHGNDDAVDLIVMGGYGPGPDLSDSPGASPCMKRSDSIYRLRRRHGQWEDSWEKVPIEAPQEENESQLLGGMQVKRTVWTAREGAAACLLPISTPGEIPVLAVFGGRQSPRRPFNDLFLVDYCRSSQKEESPIGVFVPLDVRGQAPSPRWAHTLTALSGNTHCRLALLVGGRCEEGAVLDSVYLLSLMSEQVERDSAMTTSGYLMWNRVVHNDSPPMAVSRFHHSVVALDDVVFVLGGYKDPADWLEGFSEHEPPSTLCVDASRSSTSIVECPVGKVQRFGHASCTVAIQPSLTSASLETRRILVTGGVPLTDADDDQEQPILCFRPVRRAAGGYELFPEPMQLPSDLNVGPLVHHACMSLPAADDGKPQMIVVGGGVAGFAFSPCWAPSQSWEVGLDDGQPSTTSLVPTLDESPVSVSLPANISDTQKTSHIRSSTSSTQVVFVRKPQAKQLKTSLEELSLLDRAHRMTTVDPSAISTSWEWRDHLEDFVAVPVTNQCWQQLEDRSSRPQAPWMSLVEGQGEQVCPLSTSQFARHARSKGAS